MMLLFTLLACASGGDEDVCADICMELTVNCAYEAYPNCDTFAVIDCENTVW